MVKLKLFGVSFAVTAGLLLTLIFIGRSKRPASPGLQAVAEHVFVTSQLTPENVLALGSRGFRNIVDLRPDGEAPEQASSVEIKQVAEQNGMMFYYIPVPHGDIPTSAVDQLKLALDGGPKLTVLYCHSGNRAVRTYALMEASRVDGRSCDDIVKMAHDAGFVADDLRDNINERIAHREAPFTEKRR